MVVLLFSEQREVPKENNTEPKPSKMQMRCSSYELHTRNILNIEIFVTKRANFLVWMLVFDNKFLNACLNLLCCRLQEKGSY